MDLIYADESRVDQGVLLDYEFDLALGGDENDFECTIHSISHCCQAGYFLYMEGTEYGGIVDGIQSKSGTGEVVYTGRTWHGILNSKVLQPDDGQDYLICSGEANAVIGDLLTRMGLSDLFAASPVSSGLTISSYKMHRYITGYDGMRKMLASVSGKLVFEVQGDGTVLLSAVPARDYTQDEEFDSDGVDFDLSKKYNTVNHLVCLGSGELADRTVVHLYTDASGNISQTQTFTGVDEYADVYDYPNAESVDELIKSGKERLKELWGQDALSINFDPDADLYDVGDVVGAYDNVTKIAVSAEIVKKIVTIKNGQITISYEVGG